MKTLELLAPAKTADVGIAAIDCGADAVYIAGPGFGARAAASNSIEDIGRLCHYAHRYGVKIYATVNTIIYEEELPLVRNLVKDLAAAGVDALIVQDPAVVSMAEGLGMALHASTQCAIRTPEKARFTESLGYGRIVLERQMSLDTVRAVSRAVDAEIEFFVHGALCVCYSGQCYLSEYLTGRSANRGECAQACRSLYDVEDSSGKVIARKKAILSLKDYNLIRRLEDLADAGVSSFKIEGRLKGESYVRNVVRAYSKALDALVAAHPDKYRRSSFGKVRGGFVPDLDKTFNRGYTELFLDGRRGSWAAEGGGEYVGKVQRLTRDGFVLDPANPSVKLANGDGFTFLGGGFRADVCQGYTVHCKKVDGLVPGVKLYRNLSAAFEHSLEASLPSREIDVTLDADITDGILSLFAHTEDGRTEALISDCGSKDIARNRDRALQAIRDQLGKRSGIYRFTISSLTASGDVPMLSAAFLNGLRRSLGEQLDSSPVNAIPLRKTTPDPAVSAPTDLTYKANIANSEDRAIYSSRGTKTMEQAYELTHRPGAELMRSRYCVRHQLGLCPKQKPGTAPEPLFLINNGKRLRLRFHCPTCEMTVEEA